MSLPVAILAGGKATRLLPVTEHIPKSLVDINGEPFIAHQLRLLKSRGIEKAVICAGYLGEMIHDFAGDGSLFNVQVQYSFDGEQPLGTGGAVKKAITLLGERFFVLYGDSYLPCDYRAIEAAFESCGRQAMMTVYKNDGAGDASNVEFKDGEILVYEKQQENPRLRHIDYGLGVFNKAAFDSVPGNTASDLADIYRSLLEKGELAAFEVNERFFEIGSFEGLEDLKGLLAEGDQTG